MKTKNTFAVLSLIGCLASVSPTATAGPENVDIDAAIRNAVTRADHEAVARYYDDAATQMQAKLQEQKELLEHYEDKSYLYARRAPDMQAHTDALIRNYEKAMKVNIKEAAIHRQMASQLEESNYALTHPQKLSAMGHAHRNRVLPE